VTTLKAVTFDVLAPPTEPSDDLRRRVDFTL